MRTLAPGAMRELSCPLDELTTTDMIWAASVKEKCKHEVETTDHCSVCGHVFFRKTVSVFANNFPPLF